MNEARPLRMISTRVLGCALAALALAPAAGAGPPFDHPFVPGELIVRFEPRVPPVEAVVRILDAGALAVDRRPTPGLFLAHSLPEIPAMQAVLLALAADPLVVDAFPNYLGEAGTVPNDPVLSDQWHLEQASDADVDATAAWDVTQGSPEVVVAVLDSGLAFDQPEFAGRIYANPGEIAGNGVDDDGNGWIDDAAGWDFVDDDPDPTDLHGHGTRVASVLGANADNGFEVAGMDHAARLLVLRVLDAANLGTTADLIDALTYVAGRGDVDVVNLSLINYPPIAPLADALAAAGASGSLLVACAGNGGPDTADGQYPGAHPATLSVGATTVTDELATFSSTGSTVAVVAPGEGIVMADAAPPYAPTTADVGSGCSYATPIVAGIASLMRGLFPAIGQADLETFLAVSAADLGAPGRDPAFGWGRVDAHAALLAARAGMSLFADGFESGDTSAWSAAP